MPSYETAFLQCVLETCNLSPGGLAGCCVPGVKTPHLLVLHASFSVQGNTWVSEGTWARLRGPATRSTLLTSQDNDPSDQEPEKLRNQRNNLGVSLKNECANWRDCKQSVQREKNTSFHLAPKLGTWVGKASPSS